MILLFFMSLGIGLSFGIVDFCSVNQFKSSTNYMQFTKEVSAFEYTEKGRFKGLHCCSKGYRSIEWYKDGRPYPWANEMSSFIIYPESENQTIYAKEVSTSDTGNYTCIVKNDTTTFEESIHLRVIDILPDVPVTTYFPPREQNVKMGDSTRMFCEAFVGLVNLPDAQNSISWYRHISPQNHSGLGITSDRVNIEVVTRENKQIIGAYLTISDVKLEDFGEYICRINNPGSFIEHRTWLKEIVEPTDTKLYSIPWKMIIFATIVLTLIVIKLFLLNVKYGLPARVNLKDRFGSIHLDDGKTHDVTICHSPQDSEIIKDAFLNTLQNTYKYTCQTQFYPSGLKLDLTKTRHTVAVLSKHSVPKWDVPTLTATLEHLLKLDATVTCVFLDTLPEAKSQPKNQQGKTFSDLLHDLHALYYDRSHARQFWLLLRLRLPPKRVVGNRSRGASQENLVMA